MDMQAKLNLIKRNTQEIIGEDELKELIDGKKQPVVYLGTAITGSPHIGYYMWVLKLADFLTAGFKVKVLLSDITGALDNTPWEVLDKRYNYYASIIPLMFKSIGTSVKNLEFVKSSDINLSKEYYLDLLKLSTKISVSEATKAAAEVVKLGDNPKLGGLIYPLVQTLDEEYLKVDVQYGGADQRKIFVFARENLPKLGYKSRIEVMTPLISGLIGKKMSASIEGSKIDLLDDEATVEKKINKAEFVEGNPDNGLMEFIKYIIFTIKNDNGEKFIVERSAKFGGKISYSLYSDLEIDIRNKKLHPMDLKKAVAREINKLLKPFREDKEIKKLYELAYGEEKVVK